MLELYAYVEYREPEETEDKCKEAKPEDKRVIILDISPKQDNEYEL